MGSIRHSLIAAVAAGQTVLGMAAVCPLAWCATQSGSDTASARPHPLHSRVLLEIAPGFGELRGHYLTSTIDRHGNTTVLSSCRERQPLLSMAFRLRVPFVRVDMGHDWALLWRLAFAAQAEVPTDFSGVLTPLMMGSEWSLVRDSPGRGWRLYPHAAIDFGPALPISEMGLGNQAWGYQLSLGADIAVPFSESILFDISVSRLKWMETSRWNVWWFSSPRKETDNTSRWLGQLGISFPL